MKLFYTILILIICINSLTAQVSLTPKHSARILTNNKDLVSTKEYPLFYTFNENSNELEFKNNERSLTIDLRVELEIHSYNKYVEFIGELFYLNIGLSTSFVFSDSVERDKLLSYFKSL